MAVQRSDGPRWKHKAQAGDRFGSLTFIDDVYVYDEKQDCDLRRWRLVCDCGNEVVKFVQRVVKGDVKSCGCKRKELQSQSRGDLGYTGLKGYGSYIGMLHRCYDPSHQYYEHYGGRGIKVCGRWLEPNGQGVLNFFEDMGEKPDSNHSLDRIDVNGDYSPENCKWSTLSDQAYNTRRQKSNKSGRTGVHFSNGHNKWCAIITKHYKKYHLGYFTSFEEAVKAREEAELLYFGFTKE